MIEPANPTVVYVPSYNPAVVYGAWPYPAYPPYPYYPYGGVVAAGAIGFAAGIAVGAAWNNGWGSWNWGGGDMNVNVNRNTNINGNRVSHYDSAKWNQGGRNGNVANRPGTGQRPSQLPAGAGSAGRGGDYRGYGNTGRTQGGSAGQGVSQRPSQGVGGGQGVSPRPSQGLGGASASTRPAAATRPSTDSVSKGLQQRSGGGGGGAFQGMGSGSQAKMSSDRGFSSRQSSPSSFGGSRSGGGGFSGGGGGGSRSGGGGRGGGGGGRRR